MLRFTWISPSPLNEGNDETSPHPPSGSYLVSVTDFLLFIVPAREPSPVLSFNQYFALSQIHVSHSLRSFFILSFAGGGRVLWNRVCSSVRCDSLPLPQDILNFVLQEKAGKLKSGITLQLDPWYPLFENIFVLYFTLLWRAVWRLTPSLIRFLHMV